MKFTTTSEMLQFLRCRQSWDYVSNARQALVRVGPPRVALHLGSLVHEGLAGNAKAPGEMLAPFEALKTKAAKQEAEYEEQYRRVVGMGWSDVERQLMRDVVYKAEQLLVTYFDKWGFTAPLGDLRYLPKTIETTFSVPLVDDYQLAGTFDALAIDQADRLWVIDHKTYSQKPTNKDFAFSFQFMSYMWAAEQMFGTGRVAGAIFDGISTKLPKVPSILKNGTMSRLHIATTPQVYARACVAAGLDPRNYADVIQRAADEFVGPSTDFHHRQTISFRRHAIDNHADNMRKIVADMQQANIYPNFRWEGCWDCGVQDLCHAKLNNEDTAELIRRQYISQPGSYGTAKAMHAMADEAPSPPISMEDFLKP